MADMWTPQVSKEYEEWCSEVDVRESRELRKILELLELIEVEPDVHREGIFTEARVPVDYKKLKVVPS